MFIISLKAKKIKWAAAIALAVLLVGVGGGILTAHQANRPVSAANGIVLKAKTNEERVAFFSQFGWTVNAEPVAVKEVVIPETFDETYAKYNDLQKQQGLDLERFKGARVKAWSYEITNYPATDADPGMVCGNLLVLDGVVIGGDVSATALNGFMHGFQRPNGS